MASPVPAWKRLGLKLKYANEEPSKDQEDLNGVKVNGIGSHAAESGLPDRPAKRQKLSAVEDSNNDHNPNHHARTTKARKSSSHQPENGTGQVVRRKKSVAFTDDTKDEDGDTRTTIDFPVGSPGSTPKKSALLNIDEPTSSPSPAVNAEADTALAKKPRKKEKTGKKLKSKQSKDKSKPALDYLEQHRHDRQAWKFNKNRDVWILSHALNTKTIPSSHVLALAGYIQGLPDKAGSRVRLVKDCNQALAESRLDADDKETEQQQFLEFLAGSKTDNDEVEAFLQRHSRPAILLWALGEDVGATAGVASDKAVTKPNEGGIMKKKKSRTMAPIDLSSSSESDSDSDTSSDSDQSDTGRVPKAKASGSTEVDEGTSSSGSSSETEDIDADTSSSGSTSDSD